MGFESGRANRCNRFATILSEMRGSTLAAQDTRVENARSTASAPVRIPTIPIPGQEVARPRRDFARLLVVGAVVYFVVMGA